MSRPRDEDLVRVMSEGELRPGIWVQARTGPPPGIGDVWMFLKRYEPEPMRCEGCGESLHPGWAVLGLPTRRWCAKNAADAIEVGKLYRLRDETPAQEQTTERSREAVS